MASARDAKDWARSELDRPLIGDSLYTPFCGRDGEALDLDAYRALVRHRVDALDRRLLFVTSGNGEFWPHGVTSGLDDLQGALTRFWTCAPERPDSFTHWGGAFKCAAAQLGLPIGDHPDSRPLQQALTEAVANSIREIYEASDLADDLLAAG